MGDCSRSKTANNATSVPDMFSTAESQQKRVNHLLDTTTLLDQAVRSDCGSCGDVRFIDHTNNRNLVRYRASPKMAARMCPTAARVG